MIGFVIVSFYYYIIFDQGHTPEALALAKDIDGKLDILAKLVDDAIKRTSAEGKRLPAATTEGQFDQAMNYIDDPRYNPNSIGVWCIFY